MLSKPIIKEVARVTLLTFAFGAVMVAVFAVCGLFDLTVVWGALLGCAYASFNFLLTAVSVERSVNSGSENAAKLQMMGGYYLRLILAAVVIIWAIKASYFNMWAAVIPFVFPRAAIYVFNFTDAIRRKKDGR